MSRPDEVQYVKNRRELVNLITMTMEVVTTLLEPRFWAEGADSVQLQYPYDDFTEGVDASNRLQVLKITEENKASGKRQSGHNVLEKGVMAADGTGAKETRRALLTYLLQDKLDDCKKHLGRLLQRITDNRSKVLVTGDLNSGKSTLVNAILKHNLLPSDQQPCTLIFAEVIDSAHNGGVEEIHCILPHEVYSSTDPSTYTKKTIGDLQNLIEVNKEGFERLKVYYDDKRCTSGSILKSDLIEITIIDSPGLNIDTAKTTALFAKQEEIDAIVFVVNAENHFTLSGREFLETAGKEKAYIFIAINKFDMIRNKDRCKKTILKQIEEISPLTHKELESLVHFVSAKYRTSHVLSNDTVSIDSEYDMYQQDFIRLEECLSSFILEKRSRSKLTPAKMYLSNLLSDIVFILEYNKKRIGESLFAHKKTVDHYLPELRSMSEFFDNLYNVEAIVDKGCSEIEDMTKELLKGLVDNIDSFANMIKWESLYNYTNFGNALCSALHDTSDYFLEGSLEEIKPILSKYKCDIKKECIRLIDIYTANDAVRTAKLIRQTQSLSTDTEQNSMPIPALKLSSLTPGFLDEVKPIIMSELRNNLKIQKFVRDYSPSTGMMILGAVGSRYYIVKKSNYLQPLNNTQRNDATNIIILTLVTSGIAIFMYKLSNMKDKIRRKVIDRVKNHIQNSMYIPENTSQICSYARSQLLLPVNTLRATISETICESESKINSSKCSISGLEGLLSSINDSLTSLVSIKKKLIKMNL